MMHFAVFDKMSVKAIWPHKHTLTVSKNPFCENNMFLYIIWTNSNNVNNSFYQEREVICKSMETWLNGYTITDEDLL